MVSKYVILEAMNDKFVAKWLDVYKTYKQVKGLKRLGKNPGKDKKPTDADIIAKKNMLKNKLDELAHELDAQT